MASLDHLFVHRFGLRWEGSLGGPAREPFSRLPFRARSRPRVPEAHRRANSSDGHRGLAEADDIVVGRDTTMAKDAKSPLVPTRLTQSVTLGCLRRDVRPYEAATHMSHHGY